MRCFLLLSFLLLLPLLGRAQETRITGRVVDAVTKKPILFAAFGLCKERNGGLTNKDGYFQLRVLNKFEDDSLVFIKLGYSRRAVFVENGKTADLLIALNPRKITRANNCLNRPYTVDAEALRIANDELIYGLPGAQYAFFIANEKQKQSGKLRTVSFYLGENGLPMEPFRIRIYKADGNYYSPKTDLLNERIFVDTNNPGKWCTINLERYNIAVPEDGYYIALEFVNPANELSQPGIENYIPSGHIMRPAFQARKSTTWSYTLGKDWRWLPQSNSLRKYNSMLKVEVDAVE